MNYAVEHAYLDGRQKAEPLVLGSQVDVLLQAAANFARKARIEEAKLWAEHEETPDHLGFHKWVKSRIAELEAHNLEETK